MSVPSPRRDDAFGPVYFESLEARVVLSGGVLPPGASWVEWGVGSMAARSGSYVVTFDHLLDARSARARALEVASVLGAAARDVRVLGLGGSAVFVTDSTVTREMARRAAEFVHGVKAVEPNALFKPSAVPNDPRFLEQWALQNTGQVVPGSGAGITGADVKAPAAWDVTTGSRSVIAAVIDTGVEVNHPDLRANIWTNPGEIPGNGIDDGNGLVDDVNGYDFGEFDNDPTDLVGHGTSVAGVIGAVGNDGVGITGVAWAVSILPLKIADRFGSLTLDAIVSAHDYATMMRGRGFDIAVSNNSYGGFAPAFYATAPTGFAAEKDAIQRFVDSGATFVAAAGNASFDNDNPNATFFPSSYKIPGVISVAATTNQDTLAGFSNYGRESVDFGAPGQNILTTAVGGTYTITSGTSFAAPMVAGAIALLKSHKPAASAVEMRQALIDSADPLPTLQNRTVAGGRINIARALEVIGISGPVVRQIIPGPVTGQLDPSTGTPLNTLRVTFNKDIDPAFLSGSRVSLVRAGPDGVLGTGDDVAIPLSGTNPVVIAPPGAGDPRTVVVTLNLLGQPLQRLPISMYRLTLDDLGFRDTAGNFLNGNSAAGKDHVYDFRVAAATGENEPNDTIALATPVVFSASGQATFLGATLGNGLAAGLDVDLYRVDMARGGQITAEITAKRLPGSSTLDSHLRLFNALGIELTANDQFFGADSYIDFFVSTGGTYYLGVSGFGNAGYNPQNAASGTPQSTGVYNLSIGIRLVAEDRVTGSSTLTTPKRIPPLGTQGTTSDQITINDSRQILDVNVRLDLTHTFDQDLRISLFSPAGTEVLLVNRRGGSGDNFTGTILDDEAVTPIASGVAPFTGLFRPDAPLSAFDGQSAAGVWTLVIVDTTALNDGALIGWSVELTLENNIFGPFELNDTIPLATPLPSINGSGAQTVSAFLGDGGFGLRDRDLYRFNAEAGATLNATLSSAGTLDGALRLFDASGAPLAVASPPGTGSASISDYVFAAGGIYYLGVSEAGNTAYDPFVVAAGSPALSTGAYTLSVSVARGVSDPALTMAGNAVAAGVGSGGTLFHAGTGINFNGVEFLVNPLVGTPETFFGLTASGFAFRNSARVPGAGDELPFTLTEQSDPFNRRLVSKAVFRNTLRVERTLSYGIDDAFIAVDVTLVNTGTAALTGVAWMEAFNPEQGANLPELLGPNTFNDLDPSGKVASARVATTAFPQGLTIALAAAAGEARARANIVPTTVTLRDPEQLLALPPNDPNGAAGDQLLAMGFNIGSLGSGASATFRYFIVMGASPAAVDALLAQVNAGTGAGHLAADPANPATEVLQTNPPGQTAPILPYRVYFPEGFFGPNISTYLPITNPHDQATRVVVIARFEGAGGSGVARDQIVGELTVPANSRSGLTLVTPSGGSLLGETNTPYALEIRAQRPVAATFSHYDPNLTGGVFSALGESFTGRVSDAWSFGRVQKGPGITDVVVFYNPTPLTFKTVTTFYSSTGAPPVSLTFELEPFRRGGWFIPALLALPDGDYGVTVTAPAGVVASLSHYENPAVTGRAVANESIGVPGLGALAGVFPEGQIGLGSVREIAGVLNPNNAPATVIFSFLFANGSAYRTSLNVPARSAATLDVGSLAGFPAGQPYSTLFESNLPVTVTIPTVEFGDELSTGLADRAYTSWGFGEGFRPRDGSGHPGITEYLRLFNPGDTATTLEITLYYDNNVPGETFRRTLAPREVAQIDVDPLVTGARRTIDVWYGITVKSQSPVVAYMAHHDAFFPGGFGTLGTPLGVNVPVA